MATENKEKISLNEDPKNSHAEMSLLEVSTSRDDTLNYQTADEENSSKYFSMIEGDSTLEASSADVTLDNKSTIDTSVDDKSSQAINSLSNLSVDSVNKLQIHEKIDAANILSGGVEIFDDNENSVDEHELVIDDDAHPSEKSNDCTESADVSVDMPYKFTTTEVADVTEPNFNKHFELFKKGEDENISNLEVKEPSPVAEEVEAGGTSKVAAEDSQDADLKLDNYSALLQSILPEGSSEVTLLIDEKNVDAIDIGDGVFIYKNDDGELTAIQITMNADGTNQFKCLHVGKNEDGNLEVYEEQVSQVPVTNEELESMKAKELSKQTDVSETIKDVKEIPKEVSIQKEEIVPPADESKISTIENEKCKPKVETADKDNLLVESGNLDVITEINSDSNSIESIEIIDNQVIEETAETVVSDASTALENVKQDNNESVESAQRVDEADPTITTDDAVDDPKEIPTDVEEVNPKPNAEITISEVNNLTNSPGNIFQASPEQESVDSALESNAEICSPPDEVVPSQSDVPLEADNVDTTTEPEVDIRPAEISEIKTSEVSVTLIPNVPDMSEDSSKNSLNSDTLVISEVLNDNNVIDIDDSSKSSSESDLYIVDSKNKDDICSTESSDTLLQAEDVGANPENLECDEDTTKSSEILIDNDQLNQISNEATFPQLKIDEQSKVADEDIQSLPPIELNDNVEEVKLVVNQESTIDESIDVNIEHSPVDVSPKPAVSDVEIDTMPIESHTEDVTTEIDRSPEIIEDIQSCTKENSLEDVSPATVQPETCELNIFESSADSSKPIESSSDESKCDDLNIKVNVCLESQSEVSNVSLPVDSEVIEISDSVVINENSLPADKAEQNTLPPSSTEPELPSTVENEKLSEVKHTNDFDEVNVEESVEESASNSPLKSAESQSSMESEDDLEDDDYVEGEPVTGDVEWIATNSEDSLTNSLPHTSSTLDTLNHQPIIEEVTSACSPAISNESQASVEEFSDSNKVDVLVEKPDLNDNNNEVSPALSDKKAAEIKIAQSKEKSSVTEVDFDKFVRRNSVPLFEECTSVDFEDVSETVKTKSVPVIEQRCEREKESVATIGLPSPTLYDNGVKIFSNIAVNPLQNRVANKIGSPTPEATLNRSKFAFLNVSPVREKSYNSKSVSPILQKPVNSSKSPIMQKSDVHILKYSESPSRPFTNVAQLRTYSLSHKYLKSVPVDKRNQNNMANEVVKPLSPATSPHPSIPALSMNSPKLSNVNHSSTTPEAKERHPRSKAETPSPVNSSLKGTTDVDVSSPESPGSDQVPKTKSRQPRKQVFTPVTRSDMEIIFPNLYSNAKEYRKESEAKGAKLKLTERVINFKQMLKKGPQKGPVNKSFKSIDKRAVNSNTEVTSSPEPVATESALGSKIVEAASDPKDIKSLDSNIIQSTHDPTFNKSTVDPKIMKATVDSRIAKISPDPKIVRPSLGYRNVESTSETRIGKPVSKSKNVSPVVEGIILNSSLEPNIVNPILESEKSCPTIEPEKVKSTLESNVSLTPEVESVPAVESENIILTPENVNLKHVANNVNPSLASKTIKTYESKNAKGTCDSTILKPVIDSNNSKMESNIVSVDPEPRDVKSTVGSVDPVVLNLDKSLPDKIETEIQKSPRILSADESPIETNITSSPLSSSAKRKRGRPKKNQSLSTSLLSSDNESPSKKILSDKIEDSPRRVESPVKELPKRDDSPHINSISPFGKINDNIKCPMCFKTFRSENVLLKHVKHCNGVIDKEVIKSPRKRKIVSNDSPKEQDDDISVPSKESSKLGKFESTDDNVEERSSPKHENINFVDSMPKFNNEKKTDLCDKTPITLQNTEKKRKDSDNDSVIIVEPTNVMPVKSSLETITIDDSILSNPATPDHVNQKTIRNSTDFVNKTSEKSMVVESVSVQNDSDASDSTDKVKVAAPKCSKEKSLNSKKIDKQQTNMASPMSRLSKITPAPANTPIECEICGKTFRQLAHMVYHRDLHTVEEITPPADNTQVQSTNKQSVVEQSVVEQSIAEQVVDNSVEVDTILKCEICHKGFRKLHHLVQHRDTHVNNESRSRRASVASVKSEPEAGFRCDTCDKSFRKLHHLVKHRDLHLAEISENSLQPVTETKPAEDATCSGCGKSFRKRHHMVEHRDIHCSPSKKGKAEDGSSTDNNIRLSIASSTSEEGNNCGICGKSYRKLHHMVEHRESHSEVREEKNKNLPEVLNTKDIIHECSRCYMVFPNENSLNKHVIICSRKKLLNKTKSLQIENAESAHSVDESSPSLDKLSVSSDVEPVSSAFVSTIESLPKPISEENADQPLIPQKLSDSSDGNDVLKDSELPTQLAKSSDTSESILPAKDSTQVKRPGRRSLFPSDNSQVLQTSRRSLPSKSSQDSVEVNSSTAGIQKPLRKSFVARSQQFVKSGEPEISRPVSSNLRKSTASVDSTTSRASSRRSTVSSASVESKTSLTKRRTIATMEFKTSKLKIPLRKSLVPNPVAVAKDAPSLKHLTNATAAIKKPLPRDLRRKSSLPGTLTKDDDESNVKYMLNEESELKYKINPDFNKPKRRLSQSLEPKIIGGGIVKSRSRTSESALSGLKLPSRKMLKTIMEEESTVRYSFPKSLKPKSTNVDEPLPSTSAEAKKPVPHKASKQVPKINDETYKKHIKVVSSILVSHKRKSLGGRASIEGKKLPGITKKLQLRCCGQVFSSQASLSVHRKTHKATKQVHKCDCGKGFDTEGLLKRHMDTEHTPPKSFKCADCGASVRTASQFAKHKRDHESNQPAEPPKKQNKGKAASPQRAELAKPIPVSKKAPVKTDSIEVSAKKGVKRKVAHGGVPLSDKMRRAMAGVKF